MSAAAIATAGGVRAAAAERGDVAVLVDALEAGDDRDLARLERAVDRARVDVLDARARERAVGEDPDLVAEQRPRLAALGVDREREQADRDLLAGRRDHVELALVGQRSAICLARPSRRLVSPDIAETMTTTSWPLRWRREAAPRDVADAFDGADRGAAVFLHDQQGARTFQHLRRAGAPSRAPLAVGEPAGRGWPMAAALEVHITAPDVDSAAAMARTLVGEGLLRLRQYRQGGAVDLRLRGRICDEPEVLCVVKTRAELFAASSRACASCTRTRSRRSSRSRSTKAARRIWTGCARRPRRRSG